MREFEKFFSSIIPDLIVCSIKYFMEDSVLKNRVSVFPKPRFYRTNTPTPS